MATTNATATAAAIVVDETQPSAETDKVWKGIIQYDRKSGNGFAVKRVRDGKRIGFLIPTSRKVADTSGAMRATYRCGDNPDMPDMLWRHCLVWLAARHAGVVLPTQASTTSK